MTSAIDLACRRIMPAWPLDHMIAVNPYWRFIDRPFARAIAELRQLRDARPLTPALLDAARGIDAFAPFVVDHVSETCATFFDRGQVSWRPPERANVYAAWLDRARADLAPELTLGLDTFRADVARLPEHPRACVEAVLDELAIPAEAQADFLTALLLSVSGWAAHCAYLAWPDEPKEGSQLEALLAVRAAWELILFREARDANVLRAWRTALRPVRILPRDEAAQLRPELVFQQVLARGLEQTPKTPEIAPALQAVFCIDVRSEPMRRALEECEPGAQTLGFAGFFGLPIAYRAATARTPAPHAPGLLTPSLQVSESGHLQEKERATTQQAGVRAMKLSPASMFSFVEAFGVGELFRLGKHAAASVPAKRRAPSVAVTSDLSAQQKVSTAAAILRGMSLTRGFARHVLLLGHGASTTNNAHSAAYECGACGGHAGDISARVAADLLNDRDVRRGLRDDGISIPDDTRFIAGLHDTTTDAITLFDEAPTALTATLAPASQLAAARRAEQWQADRPAAHRAADWSEVRPEWGLCNNAAFIAAPRARTRHLDLGGRVFLHDYDHRADPERRVLTQIMTAPVVVAHWINMQYYASRTDPQHYGSGNKVLHNVVAGGLGVLEGNGGDLRIGLPLQALHDGRAWRHDPLRLSVYVEAPRSDVQAVIDAQPVLRQLVGNRWIWVFAIDDGRVLGPLSASLETAAAQAG